MNGDTDRDAWLREALRHAPDAGATPPTPISEAILAQARAATASARRPEVHPRLPSGLLAFWDWLARPPIAAGFASVMVATLIGLMWWDRPLDETLPRPPSPTSADAPKPMREQAQAPVAERAESPTVPGIARPKPSPTAVPPAAAPSSLPKETRPSATVAPTPAPAVTTNRAEPAPVAKQGAAAKQAETLAQNEAKSRRAADEPTSEALRPAPRDERPADTAARRNDAPNADTAAAPAPFPAIRPRASEASDRALTGTMKNGEAPAAAQARGKAAAEPDIAGRESESSAGATPDAATQKADKSALAAEQRRARATAGGRAADTVAPAVAAPRAPARPGEMAATAPIGRVAPGTADDRPLAPLLASLANENARWSRQEAGGAAVAIEPGFGRWLAEIDAATAGRWRPAAGSVARDGAEDGASLRLFFDGRLAAIVRIGSTTVFVEVPRGDSFERKSAPLPPADVDRLRSMRARLPS